MVKSNIRNLDEKVKENSKFDWEKFSLKIENKNQISNEENPSELDSTETLRKEVNDDDFSFYSKYEQFNEEEMDTYKTNANMSCLWELYTLKNHFSFKIRSLVNKFEKNFLHSKEFDLNSVSNLEETDLLYDLNEGSNFYITSQTDFGELTKKIKIFI
jgi:hypothetical protein